MRFLPTPIFQSLVLVLSAAGPASAQLALVSELSFGHNGKLNTDGPNNLQGFTLLGKDNVPQVMSNKIILTPPAPGLQRGAVWSKQKVTKTSWIADVDFRVTGPERGGGNLNIWLASEGAIQIATSSIYTAPKWDGLAIVIDQYAGSAGTIRGFLNDGTIDYNTHAAVDSLAFGHCLFPYRNRGVASQLKFKHSDNGFRVEIDGKLCFETDKVRIPPGYNIGITSASAENPDSHEIFKLVVMTEQQQQQQQQQQAQGSDQGGQAQKPIGNADGSKDGGMFEDRDKGGKASFDDDINDSDASTITSSKEQFADLHNRLQTVNHHLSSIFRQGANQISLSERRQEELSGQLDQIKKFMGDANTMNDIKTRLAAIEKQVNTIKSDLSAQMKRNDKSLKGFVSDTHDELHEKILEATPGHGKLIMVIVGSQLVMVMVYVIYKRRKSSSPKKFL